MPPTRWPTCAPAPTTCAWRRNVFRKSTFTRCASTPVWRCKAQLDAGANNDRTMKALASWPPQDRRQLIGVFTDIDDTLTTDGSITPDALQALTRLKAAGLHVIPITGRPIGWCEPFA